MTAVSPPESSPGVERARVLVALALLAGSLALAPEVSAAPAPTDPVPPRQFSLLAEPPALAATTDPLAPSLKELVKADFKRVLSSPGRLHRRGWIAVALSAGALTARMYEERGDTDVEFEEGTRFERVVANTFEPMGAEGSLAVLGAFYLAGSRGHHPRAKRVAVDGAIASLIAGGVISPVLKGAFGRSRPHDSESSTDFHPFSGSSSFPSGHTTQAFAVASVIATEYDSRWIAAAAYGTATLAGYARALHDRHYTSDVVGGALLGTLVGRTVVRHNRRLREGGIEVRPSLGESHLGVVVAIHRP
jgi:membrane-associated phospholipid phosphatase